MTETLVVAADLELRDAVVQVLRDEEVRCLPLHLSHALRALGDGASPSAIVIEAVLTHREVDDPVLQLRDAAPRATPLLVISTPFVMLKQPRTIAAATACLRMPFSVGELLATLRWCAPALEPTMLRPLPI